MGKPAISITNKDFESTKKLDDSEAMSSLKSWSTVFILIVFYIFAMLDRQIITMIVDPIKTDLGVTDVQMGMLLGFSFALFYSVCALPMGWLVDNKPRRIVVFFGVVCWSIATAMAGLAKNFLHLFTSRMFVGLGEAVLAPAAYSIISDSFPRKRITIALSVFTMGAYFGGALAVYAGSIIAEITETTALIHLPILGDVKTWQMVFFIAGVPCLFLSATIFLVPEPIRRGLTESQSGGTVGWKDVGLFLKNRPLLWTFFTIAFVQMNIMLNSFIMWQPTFISRHFGWTPIQYGPYLALIVLIPAIAGKLFAGFTADYFWSRKTKDIFMRYYLYVIPVGAPLTIYGLLSAEIMTYFIFICFFFFFLSPFQGVAAAAIQITTPNKLRGKVSALFLLVTNIVGLGAGPVIVSLIAEHIVHDQVNLGKSLSIVILTCSSIAFVCMWLGLKHMRAAMKDAEAWS